MRMKQQIKEMEHKAEALEFPAANHRFDRFQANLKEVVEYNCGYAVAQTMCYDDYEQVFCFDVSVRRRPLPRQDNDLDKFSMTLSTCAFIYPKKPLAPQIERIIEIQEHLDTTFTTLTVLLSDQRERSQKS